MSEKHLNEHSLIMEGDCGHRKEKLEFSKMLGALFTPFLSLPSFVELLSTSKAFLSADMEESSARLVPSKQIKIFNMSQAPLDADKPQPHDNDDGIAHFLPF